MSVIESIRIDLLKEKDTMKGQATISYKDKEVIYLELDQPAIWILSLYCNALHPMEKGE